MSHSLAKIDGKFYKKCKVVMLPTEKKSIIGGIVKRSVDNKLVLHTDVTQWHGINQHLYILSDEEIKEGDWKYNSKLDFIWKHNRLNKAQELKNICHPETRKIIASTDVNLNLPVPSNVFLSIYCEKGGIDEVFVEYVKKHTK